MEKSIKRRITKSIKVGSVLIGGNSPISVQSMTNTRTDDVESTVSQILRLERAGCDIVRVAVHNQAAANAIKKVKESISIPLIADIHFNYKLAILSTKAGADALRFNPGNIGGQRKLKSIVLCAKDYGIPIRVGVNAGSLEKDILEKYNGPTAQGMVDSALKSISMLHGFDFTDIKVSMKASDVIKTIQAYRILSKMINLPFHVGITEAGTMRTGTIKSALGIGTLLLEGIGDTIRVSLTCDPVEEVRVGFDILKILSIRKRGPEIISCPTCGRCEIDVFEIVKIVEKSVSNIAEPVKIAVMGCSVNGPGEAKEADIGIAGGRQTAVLFKKGKIIGKLPEQEVVNALLSELDKFKG